MNELFNLKIFTDVHCIIFLRTKLRNGQWKPKSTTHWGLYTFNFRSKTVNWFPLISNLWINLQSHHRTSHRCLIGFRSRECEGHLMASMPSSYRNCLHTMATWSRAFFLHQEEPRAHLKVWQSLWGFHPNSSQRTVGNDMEDFATRAGQYVLK